MIGKQIDVDRSLPVIRSLFKLSSNGLGESPHRMRESPSGRISIGPAWSARESTTTCDLDRIAPAGGSMGDVGPAGDRDSAEMGLYTTAGGASAPRRRMDAAIRVGSDWGLSRIYLFAATHLPVQSPRRRFLWPRLVLPTIGKQSGSSGTRGVRLAVTCGHHDPLFRKPRIAPPHGS